jgi:hypothetical protein
MEKRQDLTLPIPSETVPNIGLPTGDGSSITIPWSLPTTSIGISKVRRGRELDSMKIGILDDEATPSNDEESA